MDRQTDGQTYSSNYILDLWGITFHAVVVVGLGKDLLFKSVLGHCEKRLSVRSISVSGLAHLCICETGVRLFYQTRFFARAEI